MAGHLVLYSQALKDLDALIEKVGTVDPHLSDPDGTEPRLDM